MGVGLLFTSFINKYSLGILQREAIGTERQDVEGVGIENEFGIADSPSGVRLAFCLYATLNTAVLVDGEVLVKGSPATEQCREVDDLMGNVLVCGLAVGNSHSVAAHHTALNITTILLVYSECEGLAIIGYEFESVHHRALSALAVDCGVRASCIERISLCISVIGLATVTACE